MAQFPAGSNHHAEGAGRGVRNSAGQNPAPYGQIMPVRTGGYPPEAHG